MRIRKTLLRICKLTLILLLWLLLLLLFSFKYLFSEWGEVSFETVIYQLLSPLEGTNKEVITRYIEVAVIPSILLVVGGIVFNLFLSIICYSNLIVTIRFKDKIKKIEIKCTQMKRRILKAKYSSCIVILFVILTSLFNNLQRAGIFQYLESIKLKSTIFEDYYIRPDDNSITFTDKKKNLIYIYAESMESSYTNRIDSNKQEINYIPKLTELAKKNISFSNDDNLGGLVEVPLTGWTMAAILASTSGVPYKLPIEGNSAGEYGKFLPGLVTLGDVLQENGYQNYFMCGSEIEFGGRELYLREHGDYTIFDYNSAILDNMIPNDYHVFWGIEDNILFEYAKNKLEEIANTDENFNFTLLTVDTHHPEGYQCTLCKNEYEEKYGNVIRCADNQISSFIEWVMKQEWYRDTVIVVTGDHLSMNNTFFDNTSQRSIYNCIINSNTDVYISKNRKASILDLFPTTLAALGAQIKQERLGLGTNLFSKKNTIPEEIGEERFFDEIVRYSQYYVDEFIRGNH